MEALEPPTVLLQRDWPSWLVLWDCEEFLFIPYSITVLTLILFIMMEIAAKGRLQKFPLNFRYPDSRTSTKNGFETTFWDIGVLRHWGRNRHTQYPHHLGDTSEPYFEWMSDSAFNAAYSADRSIELEPCQQVLVQQIGFQNCAASQYMDPVGMPLQMQQYWGYPSSGYQPLGYSQPEQLPWIRWLASLDRSGWWKTLKLRLMHIKTSNYSEGCETSNRAIML